MNDTLINIENHTFFEANKIIRKLCEDRIKLTLDDINCILNLKETELVNSFFNEYSLFDREDFLLIERFINQNLEHADKDFVSDLIYFALDFGLDLEYKKIVSFLLIKEVDEDCLVLACLEYLSHNIKFLYIEELVKNLKYIRNTVIYHQNEQLLASLILFRVTHKSEYLNFIQELIEFDSSNLEFLNNTLKNEMYDERYFDFTSFNPDGSDMFNGR